MIDLIVEMLKTPDAQTDPYVWSAALLGHYAIGVFLCAVAGAFWAVWWVSMAVGLAYLCVWEGVQVVAFGSQISDSFVDAAAVLAGAMTTSGLWAHNVYSIAAGFVMMLSMLFGGNKRGRDA